MSKFERNRYYMLVAVEKVSETYRSKWEEFPDFEGPMAQLSAYLRQFEALRKEKAELKVSLVSSRDSQWVILGQKLHQLAGFLYTKAKAEGNEDAMELLQVTRTNLETQSFESTILLAKRILGLAEGMVNRDSSDLQKSLVKDAKALYQIFENNGMRPRERQIRSGQVTKMLAGLYREIAIFLRDELDPLMRYFKDKEAEFYSAYQRARIIPKLTGQQRPLTQQDEEAETGALAAMAAPDGPGASAMKDPPGGGNDSNSDQEEAA